MITTSCPIEASLHAVYPQVTTNRYWWFINHALQKYQWWVFCVNVNFTV